MKRGDKVPVNLGQHVVAQAEVVEINNETATLVVPATKIVMGIRHELTDLPKDDSGKQVIIDPPKEAEPVVDVAPANDNNVVTDTPPKVETPAVEAPAAADAAPTATPEGENNE